MNKYLTLDRIVNESGIPFCIQAGTLDNDFEIHTHSFSELVIVTGGTAKHIIDGREYDVRVGDAYVLNGDTSHGFRNTNKLSLYNIMYYPDRLYAAGGGLRKLPGFQALFILEPYYRKEHRFKYKLRLSPVKLKYVLELLDIMLEEYGKMQEACEAVLQAHFMSLVAYLSREYASGKTSENSKNDLLNLAGAVAYMESHYTEPITLKQLSGSLSISCRHFIRIFRKNYNATPMEYIIRLRLKHATELLGSGSLNITRAAYESGFTDSNYFSRLFHKRYGMSPRKYMNMVRSQACSQSSISS